MSGIEAGTAADRSERAGQSAAAEGTNQRAHGIDLKVGQAVFCGACEEPSGSNTERGARAHHVAAEAVP